MTFPGVGTVVRLELWAASTKIKQNVSWIEAMSAGAGMWNAASLLTTSMVPLQNE